MPYVPRPGLYRVDVPVADPDFGKLVPCRCRLVELADHRADTLRSESELEVLSRMTFETFVPEGAGCAWIQADQVCESVYRLLVVHRH